MSVPFLVLGMPRSRTAWLAHWLGCTHDMAIECDTVDQFLTSLATSRGSVETGAVDGWPVIQTAIPNIRAAAVFRPAHEVIDRLTQLGVAFVPTQIEERAEKLMAFAKSPGVLPFSHRDLSDADACCQIFTYCTGMPFDWHSWRAARKINVQVDLGARVTRLAERAEQTAALKREVAERISSPRPFVLVRFEPWAECAVECEALGRQHYAEARGGNEGEFHLNIAALQSFADARMFYVCTARLDGKLVGYCLWTKEVSFETKAPLTALQGPFFVLSGLEKHRLGQRLLDASETALEQAGFKVFDYHHTMLGRGARASVMYRRRGATPHQMHHRRKVAA